MEAVTDERIPRRTRSPWFAIWVPAFLLLYVVVNGGGYMGALYEKDDLRTLPRVTEVLLDCRQIACGTWGLLVWPILGMLACSSWFLAPQWSFPVRWGAGVISMVLLAALVLAQLSLYIPFFPDFSFCNQTGSRYPLYDRRCYWHRPLAEFVLRQTWQPHFHVPGAGDPFPESIR